MKEMPGISHNLLRISQHYRLSNASCLTPETHESGRAAAAAEAGPTSGGEDCGRDEAAGVSFELRRRDSTTWMAVRGPRKGGAMNAEGDATPTSGGEGSTAAARDRMRWRGTCPTGSGGKGSNCGGAARVRPRRARGVQPAAATPCLGGGGDGLPRRRI
ncbi:hypothetical protein Syun_027655 [Stephania yunnanensis]|uniref:Uncharacterized protein n=1 Tax=Stephania yunnanensis TaxID=152371 RepID=A0AAP0HN05_9MAGN